jgi:hypothetical protein
MRPAIIEGGANKLLGRHRVHKPLGHHMRHVVSILAVLLLGVTASVHAQGSFQPLPELSRAESWRAPADGVAVAALSNDVVTLAVGNLQANESRVVGLVKPVPLAGAGALNYWTCFAATQEEYGVSLAPLFADKDGKEIRPGKDDFLCSHIGVPNARRAGLWWYDSWPCDAKAAAFTGFAVQVTYAGGNVAKKPHIIYLKDFGLERTDYRAVPLYYMVGNYRDNFGDPSFNNMRAHTLTSENGGDDKPWLLLDNLLDQAKQGRPARVNLRYYVYDIRDRLVYAGKRDGLAAVSPTDFFVKLPVPITAEGTYNIKGKTFDADSGEYFTTDWVKLVILRGKEQALSPMPFPGLLAINADKPYGKLERTDRLEIVFQVGAVDPGAGPLELRYAVIPNSNWVPRWSAARPVTFDHTMPVTNAGALTVPYDQKRTVELVVAGLWRGERCLDREERLIGVANALDRTPEFTSRAQMPSLGAVTGPGKCWVNATILVEPGKDLYEVVARNMDELKKISTDLSFRLDSTGLEPMPGVYDWDAVTPYFDLAVKKGCRLLPYMDLKWPVNWTPLEFLTDDAGCVHRVDNLYCYMAGKYMYFNGTYSPGIHREFITQFARRYLNHAGLLGYYFENEHADTKWLAWPVSRSYHEARRKVFAAFVAARYASIENLNAAYGTGYASFSQVELPSVRQNARKAALADILLFRRQSTENAVLRDEVDAVRAVDPQRPIIVYGLSTAESDTFMRRLVAQGCMMANGGVHSTINVDYEYERPNSTPGLLYRMEPHDCWNYDPIKNGYDEMIFGMLGMGGRGLHFHFFLHPQTTFSYEKAMQPGQQTGYDKLVKHMPVMRELSSAEKQHDPVGILELYQNVFGGPWRDDVWALHRTLYARLHYSPRIAAPEIDPGYLKDSKIVFVVGDTVSARHLVFLKTYLEEGGHVVLTGNSGRYSFDQPDNQLLSLPSALGLAVAERGAHVAGVTMEHDLYAVGKGQVTLLRRSDIPIDAWMGMIPALLKWGSVTGRLADSADPDMQIHVLKSGNTFYLATTHRNEMGGPESWSGQVRWCGPLPEVRYQVTELMSGTKLGEFTPAQLAAGFDAGAYGNLQMKIFRIAAAP